MTAAHIAKPAPLKIRGPKVYSDGQTVIMREVVLLPQVQQGRRRRFMPAEASCIPEDGCTLRTKPTPSRRTATSLHTAPSISHRGCILAQHHVLVFSAIRPRQCSRPGCEPPAAGCAAPPNSRIGRMRAKVEALMPEHFSFARRRVTRALD